MLGAHNVTQCKRTTYGTGIGLQPSRKEAEARQNRLFGLLIGPNPLHRVVERGSRQSTMPGRMNVMKPLYAPANICACAAQLHMFTNSLQDPSHVAGANKHTGVLGFETAVDWGNAGSACRACRPLPSCVPHTRSCSTNDTATYLPGLTLSAAMAKTMRRILRSSRPSVLSPRICMARPHSFRGAQTDTSADARIPWLIALRLEKV